MVKDLVADYPGHFEGLLAGHRVDDYVAMDADEVLGVENTILILWGMLSASSLNVTYLGV